MQRWEQVLLIGWHREALGGEKSSRKQKEYLLEQQAEALLWVGCAVGARYSTGVGYILHSPRLFSVREKRTEVVPRYFSPSANFTKLAEGVFPFAANQRRIFHEIVR